MEINVQDELIETQAASVAKAIQAMTQASDDTTEELTRRLIEFAEEIKLQAIEPD